MSDQSPPVLDIKQLIDYYKWVASLATFVLTISVTLSKASSDQVVVTFPLAFGWCLLAVCIFLNVQIIKALLVYEVAPSPYLSICGNVQLWCFYLGVGLTSLALAIHIGMWVIGIAILVTAIVVWQMVQAATWLPYILVALRHKIVARRLSKAKTEASDTTADKS